MAYLIDTTPHKLLLFVWREMLGIILAFGVGTFLVEFAQQYGASDAAPLFSLMPFSVMWVLVITTFLKIRPFLADAVVYKIFLIIRILVAVALPVSVIAGIALQRYGVKDGSLAFLISAGAVFYLGFVAPTLPQQNRGQ